MVNDFIPYDSVSKLWVIGENFHFLKPRRPSQSNEGGIEVLRLGRIKNWVKISFRVTMVQSEFGKKINPYLRGEE